MNSPARKEVRPGPWRCVSTGTSRRRWAGDHAGRARGDQRRHAVGRRRGVAQVAGERRPTLDLGRADQIGGLDHPRPSPLQGIAFADHGAGRRGADDKTAVPLANAGDTGDLLDIDDQARLAGPSGAELAGQSRRIEPSRCRGPRPNAYGLLDRRRSGIIEHDLGASKLTGRNASPASVGGPGRSAISRRPRAHRQPDCGRACNCEPPAQLSRKAKRNAAIRRGSCGRHHFARNGKAIQLGRDPASLSRRRAEGDGARAVRLGPGDAGYAGRPYPALTPRPCAHSLNRYLEGGRAAWRQGRGDRCGLPRAEVRVCRPGTRRAEFLAYDAQHHGAREGAL